MTVTRPSRHVTTYDDSTDGLGSSEEPPPAPASPAPLTPLQRRNKALLRFGLSITVLNVVGHLFLGFEQPPLVPIVAVALAYVLSVVLETIDAWANQREPEYAGGSSGMLYFLLPAHIAALACSMLIYTSTMWPYLFAVAVAVSSKYLIRIRMNGRHRHYLNPSNVGISLTLVTIPLVGFTPPYMFTTNTDNTLDVLIPLGILMAGTMINGKLTGKLPLIMGWVGGFALQAVVRTVLFDDVLLSALGTMTGVAFILYTNYMITDPGTTPADPRRQVIFGLILAAVYSVLIVAQVAFAIFFALTIVCAGRGLILFLGERVPAVRNRIEAVSSSAT